MNARKALSFLILFFVLLALPIAYRYTFHYTGSPPEREVNRPQLDEIQVPTPPAAQYTDETVIAGDGIVVVDMAHNNQIQMPELNVLASRLAARGHQLVDWTDGSLKDALLEASAFLVITPLESFEEDQVATVVEFIASGGRLLLVGDPTRYGYLVDDWGWISGIDSDARYLNSLGASFGITFVDDYLYNVNDNEGNFRNIKLSEWGESQLTRGVETVVFYAAHSLAVGDEAAVILADEDTWSSSTDRAGGLVVAAQTTGGQVLAIGDLTFMTEPFHTVRDNSRLIANVADFMTGAERTYALPDFPLFFGDKVAFIFTNNPDLGPTKLQLVDEFEELFEENDRVLVLADEPDSRTDTIFAGIYSQADPITDTLAEFGVTLIYTPTEEIEEIEDEKVASLEDSDEGTVDEITPESDGEDEEDKGEQEEQEPQGKVHVDGLGSYDMSGIGLILYQQDDRRVLLVLAASQEGLANMLSRLPGGNMYDCVGADAITLCPTGIPFEEIEPDWEPLEELPDEPEEDENGGDLPDDVQGELFYGDLVDGELAADEEHLWQFNGTAGDIVTIRVEAISADLDLALDLEDSDGTFLTSADDNLSGEYEEIRNYELPDTGDYIIRVTDFWDEGGSYVLTLDRGIEGDETTGGVITFGETVAGTLEPGLTAIWTFTGQAEQVITIILQPDEESDVLLELQDADGVTLESTDSGLSGEEERIEGILPFAGSYQIVVKEFWDEGGSYELTLLEGGEGGVIGGSGVLIVSADTGTATLDGRTSADIYFNFLAPAYDVTLWTLSEDGEIDPEDMDGYQLVIWTSGDFQGGDDYALFDYLVYGGPLLVSGAHQVFYEGDEVAVLKDIEVSSSVSVLTSGFEPGEIIELSGEIETAIFESEEDEEGVTPLFLRGPASDYAGDLIAAGMEEDEFDSIHALIVGFPLYMLPDWAQAQFVDNAVEWFQVSLL